MSSSLVRRLERALEREARERKRNREFTLIHSFEHRRTTASEFCERGGWSAHATAPADERGQSHVWVVNADTPDDLDKAIAELGASGQVPEGRWERREIEACPGGEACRHVPRVIE